jgi:hypothetical protein
MKTLGKLNGSLKSSSGEAYKVIIPSNQELRKPHSNLPKHELGDGQNNK